MRVGAFVWCEAGSRLVRHMRAFCNCVTNLPNVLLVLRDARPVALPVRYERWQPRVKYRQCHDPTANQVKVRPSALCQRSNALRTRCCCATTPSFLCSSFDESLHFAFCCLTPSLACSGFNIFKRNFALHSAVHLDTNACSSTIMGTACPGRPKMARFGSSIRTLRSTSLCRCTI